MKKKLLLAVSVFFASVLCSFSQEIMTASEYLARISRNYADIYDYQADITIRRSGSVMEGEMFYKSPDMLRINFTRPEEQVISLHDNRFVIHIPRYRVSMSQRIDRRNQVTGGAAMASREGLMLLKRNYTVAYLESPNPVPLDSDDEESEMVTKLKFVWRSTQEGFRQIDLSIGEDGYIRRLIGYTPDYEEIQFDFMNVEVNQNIPEARFEYRPPPTANVIENFLFDPLGGGQPLPAE